MPVLWRLWRVDLMHLSYPAQVNAKAQSVVETIERIDGRDLLGMSGGLGIELNPSRCLPDSGVVATDVVGHSWVLPAGQPRGHRDRFVPDSRPAARSRPVGSPDPGRGAGVDDGV